MKASAIEVRKAQALEKLVAENGELREQLNRIEAKLDALNALKKPAKAEAKPGADPALEPAKE